MRRRGTKDGVGASRMGLLTGQVCIVSGAGQGLGRAIALEMAGEGASVVLLERNPKTLADVAGEIAEAGGIARAFQLDVTDYDAYGKAVAAVIKEFKRIDVLVNNAAINPPALTILNDTLENWRRTMAINLESVFMGSKLVAPQMVEQKSGRIIHIASIQGFASSGEVGSYNAAKGGSGRTMTGGLDIRALEKPRQLFSAARNTEEGGSLTIIASALIETGSRMDDLIFQEFKGTGNMEMVLDRKVAELRLWPAMNINSSGTRKEELLIDPKRLETIHFFRRALAPLRIEDAAETMLTRLSKTTTNEAFLSLISR